MKRWIVYIGFLSLLGLISLNSCKHKPEDIIPDPPGIEPPIDTVFCDSSNVTYSGIVFPILETYCISCHSGPTPDAGLDFNNYGDVAYVSENGSLVGSVKHLPDFSPMPKGGPKISACEIALIEKWINDTTFVTPPDTTECDSSNVTYPGTVYPIIMSNCISCHGPPTPEAGIDLTDFEDVAFIAQNGALMGSIRNEANYTAMPDNAPPLTDCEIELIQKWINDTTFTTGNGEIPCDPDTAYFQNDVLPLLMSSCGIAGCHDPQTAEDDVILTSYFYVMETADVEPGEPWESDLWEKIEDDFQSDRMPPPPAPPLNQDQKDLIYNWILQGALNNYCNQEECDSVNVTFSETIFPIIQNNCYGCHSGATPSGNISLTNYSEISAAGAIPPGNTGSLLGSVSWASGNVPMPENGNQLSDCKIAQIRKWIEDGMPNN